MGIFGFKDKKEELKENGNGKSTLFKRMLTLKKKEDVNLMLAQSSLELIAKSTFEEDSQSEIIKLAFKYLTGIERLNIYLYDEEQRIIQPYVSYILTEKKDIVSDSVFRAPSLMNHLYQADPPLGLCWNERRNYASTFNMVPDDPAVKDERGEKYWAFYNTGIITPMVFQKKLLGYVEVYGPDVRFKGDEKGDPLNLILYSAGITRMLCTHMRMQTDPLTMLSRRDNYDMTLTNSISKAIAFGSELSLIYIDCDHFKQINDKYGHLAGDTVLRHIGRALQASVRANDRNVFRIGGEEFAIIADAGLEQSQIIAKRVSSSVRKTVTIHDQEGKQHDINVSASIGICDLKTVLEHVGLSAGVKEISEELKRRADNALYAAKNEFGRDCIVVREHNPNELKYKKVG